ncbi:MAG: LysE family translocator [Pseudomonadota bacterium]|nr:LysE family translocator [Pseudomonadota bacterium]
MILPVDPQRYAAFLGLMTVLAMTPGPAVLYAVATGARSGKRAALAGVAGMNSALLVWFGGAALGLGALITAYPGVFRWAAVTGALYVAWLGAQSLLQARAVSPLASTPHDQIPAPRGSAFGGGFAVQIANPKVLIFFSAILPPFLDPDRPLAPQLLLFGLGTIGMDALFISAYGLGGAALAERMSRPRFRRGFSIFAGLLLLTAAVLSLVRLRS